MASAATVAAEKVVTMVVAGAVAGAGAGAAMADNGHLHHRFDTDGKKKLKIKHEIFKIFKQRTQQRTRTTNNGMNMQSIQ